MPSLASADIAALERLYSGTSAKRALTFAPSLSAPALRSRDRHAHVAYEGHTGAPSCRLKAAQIQRMYQVWGLAAARYPRMCLRFASRSCALTIVAGGRIACQCRRRTQYGGAPVPSSSPTLRVGTDSCVLRTTVTTVPPLPPGPTAAPLLAASTRVFDQVMDESGEFQGGW